MSKESKALGYFLASLSLFSAHAFAKATCTIEYYQPIDIASETKGGVLDRESGQILIKEKPPMRCANVTFTTSHTRDRVANQMQGSFEAIYFDNQKGQSHSISFNQDEVQAGYIRIGPNNPVEAYICFTTSETPIKEISCDVN
ncbi:hypothetical protein VITU102760_15245 [Vibrio tubiashii]|uniref:Uncharacterized protein n=1 Tax=Vibrio tubiashii ATCC 19109 TaxID=1051646 RepID=F9T0N8_9VIBR|nr:hypothetical protein [Vibrio tubiashii]AIW13368.1 hypothetical protein IX91_04010 [Vibrio tubiashii ATCC 19109]EGU58664.1 hypothetical protein VITU9109_19260 [Vibrio tubiashii ATCC 19109]EIF01515.1 hypothetical protein VT1337_22851 [Vibrio tubiashii NCIMB 1337 = ATCC 19106]